MAYDDIIAKVKVGSTVVLTLIWNKHDEGKVRKSDGVSVKVVA